MTAGLALSASAEAQQLLLSRAPNTYQPLPSPTIIWTDVDDGTSTLTLPFPITHYGNSYTAITIGANGAVMFPGSQTISLSNASFGTGTPNLWVAPFWDDLRLYAQAGSYIGWQAQGTAPNRTFTVEWRNIHRYGNQGLGVFSMQVRFFEGATPRVEIDYGPNSASGVVFTASMGMEDSTGANPFHFSLNTCTPNCTYADFNNVVNTRVIVTASANPELSGRFSPNFPRGAFPGASATGDVSVVNVGLNAAANVVNNVYFSVDQTLDAQDALVGTFTVNAPNGESPSPVTITVPANAATADYFLLMRVDEPNTYAEVNELDNVVVGPRFATGYEIRPTAVAVTNGAGVNPGDTLRANVSITNDGVPRVGALEIALYVSADGVYDAQDALLGITTVNLAGQNSEVAAISGPLPNVAPGSYYVVARTDPNNLLAEFNESNNTVVGAQTFPSGPDFEAGVVTIPAGVQPGTNLAVSTRINSISVPYTGALSYRLFASVDAVFDPMTDRNLGTFSVAFAGQPFIVANQDVVFPAALPPGRWYVIAQVDPLNQVAEVSEANNVRVSGTTVINGFDFAAANVTASPGVVEVGDLISVAANIQSLGLAYTGNVDVAVYLSTDAVWDPVDQAILRTRVFIPGNAGRPVSVQAPASSLPGEPQFGPGSYRVIVVVDPFDSENEALEDNNFAVGGTVQLRGADLDVVSMTGNRAAFIGMPYQVTLTIINRGVVPARNFQYAYYLSTNDIIRVTDQQIFVSATATIAAGAQTTFTDQITLPAFTSTQTLYLGVIADIFSRVPETSEGNNSASLGFPLAIVFPIPDLRPQIVATATAAGAGESIAVTRVLYNDGVAPAASFEYAYYLSSNPTIATDDLELGRFNASLPTGGDDFGIDVLRIPTTVAPGNYFLGLLIDPDERQTEVSRDNNSVVSGTVQIFGVSLAFVTDALVPGVVGVPYEVGVYARGGALPIQWSVSAGNLPMGLTLDPQTGIISGTPVTEGPNTFTLRASSGSAFVERDFEIRITAPTVELRIASSVLPTTVVGRQYTTEMVAVGGQQPYSWNLLTPAPPGLSLSESGTLSGVPTAAGNFELTVRVRDGQGLAASRNVAINVINGALTVQVVAQVLPPAIVGVDYCANGAVRLEATNGIAPYAWAIIGDAPAGMTLSREGELCGTPTTVGSFPLLVRAQDQAGLFDSALFMLDVGGGNALAIATSALEAADLNQAYRAELEAILGSEPYVWSVVDALGALPPGITLSSNGVLEGNPSQAGTFAFGVQVVDAANRLDVQPLSITVLPPPEAQVNANDDGCGCSATESEDNSGAWWALALLPLVWRRRR